MLFSGTSSPDGRDSIMCFVFRALRLRALLNYERRLISMRTGSLGGRLYYCVNTFRHEISGKDGKAFGDSSILQSCLEFPMQPLEDYDSAEHETYGTGDVMSFVKHLTRA